MGELDGNVGFDLPDVRISQLAYVDNVSLVASTHIALQLLIDLFRAGAAEAGLRKYPKSQDPCFKIVWQGSQNHSISTSY